MLIQQTIRNLKNISDVMIIKIEIEITITHTYDHTKTDFQVDFQRWIKHFIHMIGFTTGLTLYEFKLPLIMYENAKSVS